MSYTVSATNVWIGVRKDRNDYTWVNGDSVPMDAVHVQDESQLPQSGCGQMQVQQQDWAIGSCEEEIQYVCQKISTPRDG